MSDIAIIGMAGRFPRSASIDEFWENIRTGVECMTVGTAAELAEEGIDPSALDDPTFVPVGGKMAGIDLFDAAAFGISPREATLMDPQHRLFLETAWEALDDGGYDPDRFDGPIGVYGGINMNTYLAFKLRSDVPIAEATGRIGDIITNDKDYATSRVSYKLGLRGPSITVQTACSTSLTAIALACESLISQQCDMALAGGSSVTLPQVGYFYREDGIASPDGHCRTFDVQAEGTLFGSAVGVVLLKRLADALDDGDHIHAVIKGSAINNDGTRKVGYTAPSVDGQAAVVAEALAIADVPADSIGYLECHGTATPLGDAVEIAALKQVFEAETERREFCALGTLKANMGHLVSAAGVAALIKAVLVVKHGELPPNVNFERPHPNLGIEGSPFTLAAEARPWPQGDTARRAGVSSFGIGGTNVHVVIEQAPAVRREPTPAPSHLLPLTARTEAELDRAATDLADALAGPAADRPLADVAFTLQTGRRQLGHRRVVVCRDHADAVAVLRGEDPSRMLAGVAADQPKKVAFLFAGGGSQYPNMTRELYRSSPRFRADFDECAEAFAAELDTDVRDVLFVEPDAEAEAGRQLHRTVHMLPALFSAQYALARLWIGLGVRPAAMIGHSLGEYVAATLAGVVSLADAVRIVAARARLIDRSLSDAGMASVELSEQELTPLLGPDVQIAAVNGVALCTVTGPAAALDELERELTGREVTVRRLRLNALSHSPAVEPILPEFAEALAPVRLNPPGIPYLSNVTGDWIDAEQATDPEYFVRHLRQTVRFADGVGRILTDPDTVLLDLSPGGGMASLARQHPDCARDRLVLSCVRHATDESGSDLAVLHATVGRLWLAGTPIEWSALHEGDAPRRVPLPTYPFTRKRHWPDATTGPAAGDPALYLPAWRRLPALGAGTAPERSWLVVGADEELGRAVADRLADLGGKAVTVAPDGLAAELERLAEFAGLLWLMPADGADPAALEPLRAVLGALGGQPASDSLRVVLATRGAEQVLGTEPFAPAGAAAASLLAAAAAEFTGFDRKVVDLPAAEPVPALARQLTAELVGGADTGVTAIRGGFRWLRSFDRVPLAADDTALPTGGAVLLTGRWSPAAREFCAALADSVARVVVACRDADGAAPPEGDLAALRDAPGEVTLAPVPPDDVEALRALLAGEDDRTQGPAVHAIVHLLGAGQRRGLDESGRLDTVLDEVVAELTTVDLAAEAAGVTDAVLVGSLDGWLGAPGLVVPGVRMAAAGALTASGWAAGTGRWLSIAVDQLDPAAEPGAVPGLPPAELVRAIGFALARRPGPQLVLGTVDPGERAAARLAPEGADAEADDGATDGGALAERARANIATPYVEPRNELERLIVGHWEQTLGYAPIGVHDNFFELGGDSLSATRLAARLREDLPVRPPLKQIFERPTVGALAELIDELLVQKVAALSEDEARRLLEEQ